MPRSKRSRPWSEDSFSLWGLCLTLLVASQEGLRVLHQINTFGSLDGRGHTHFDNDRGAFNHGHDAGAFNQDVFNQQGADYVTYYHHGTYGPLAFNPAVFTPCPSHSKQVLPVVPRAP
jgi:hypothetical protein